MSNPRTCLTIDKPKPSQPVTEPAAMEAPILAEVRKPCYEFVPSEQTGLSLEHGDESGWIYSTCLMSQLRTALSVQNELEDQNIFAALDRLTKKKSIIVWRVSTSRFLAGNDFAFDLVLGTARRGKRAGFTFEQVCPHWLSESSFKLSPKKPLSVTETVSALRKQERERLDRAFGRVHMPDPSLESALHRQEIEEEARLRAALLKLADACPNKVDPKELMRLIDDKK